MGKNKGISKYNIDGFHILNDGTIDIHFSLHDAEILSDNITVINGKRLELQLDIEGSFSSFHTIIFNDYLIKQNCEIKNVWILGAEFKILDNGRYVTTIYTDYYVKNKRIEEKLIVNSKSVELLSDECDGVFFQPNY